MSSFTLGDFQKRMTKSIAFSAEGDEDVKEPWNAGVALMNLPYLRETYDDFFQFILNYKKNEPYIIELKSGKRLAAPSDQGAYLKFYEESKEFLDTKFNDKPYYLHTETEKDGKILHFHGAKPHDYLGNWLGVRCPQNLEFICLRPKSATPFLCER